MGNSNVSRHSRQAPPSVMTTQKQAHLKAPKAANSLENRRVHVMFLPTSGVPLARRHSNLAETPRCFREAIHGMWEWDQTNPSNKSLTGVIRRPT